MPPYRPYHNTTRVSSLPPTMSSDSELAMNPSIATPIRASCDACRRRKLRCTGAEAREGHGRSCERCFTRGQSCVFSARKPMGRPRTVSSTPPSPPTCLSQPATPPSGMRHHYMPMFPMGNKLAPSPGHAFDTMRQQQGHDLDTAHMGWMTTGQPTPDQSNFWISPPNVLGTPTSVPRNPMGGSMFMAPSASSDGFVMGSGNEWSEVKYDNNDSPHHASARPSQRAVSVASDFMFDNSSATHEYSSSTAFPGPLRCLCESGNGIDDIRAQFRDITAGAPVVEIALGATHSVSSRLMASTTCAQCLGDKSTGTAAIAILSLVSSILTRAIPSLQSVCANDPNLLVRPFTPTTPASPAKLAVSAMEAEIESLLRATASLIAQLRSATPPMPTPAATESFPFNDMMFEHFQKHLGELSRRVSGLSGFPSLSLPTPSTPGVPALGWDGRRQSVVSLPCWEGNSPASVM